MHGVCILLLLPLLLLLLFYCEEISVQGSMFQRPYAPFLLTVEPISTVHYTHASWKFDKPTLRGVYMRMAGWECEAHTLSNTSGNLKKAYPYTQFICRNKLMWLTSLVLFCFCQACKKCPRYKPLCSLYLFQKNILFCVSHS